MLKFKHYLKEGGPSPVVDVDNTTVDIRNLSTKLEINRNLAAVLSQDFVNPYAGYVKVSKVLINYGMSLPRTVFLDKKTGEEVFLIRPFGGIHGAKLDGTVTAPGTNHDGNEHYLYFMYGLDDTGFYKCSAILTDEGTLDSILNTKEKGDLDPRQMK
jgi:hypothetical protein